jgi:hypothetical protein
MFRVSPRIKVVLSFILLRIVDRVASAANYVQTFILLIERNPRIKPRMFRVSSRIKVVSSFIPLRIVDRVAFAANYV